MIPEALEPVDALIERVMRQHPLDTPKGSAAYFEAVHQELAPLARSLEHANAELRAQAQAAWRERTQSAAPRARSVFTCQNCGNVYRAGDADVTIFGENGAARCRKCANGRFSHVMLEHKE